MTGRQRHGPRSHRRRKAIGRVRCALARAGLAALALAIALAIGMGCGFEDSDVALAACVAGRSCSLREGDVGACDEGLTRCPDGPGGPVECAPVVTGPTSEVCDGADNDCDGDVDEGIPDQVSGSDVGICEPRILACRMGTFVVIQERVGPRPEICGDGIDQDCDGSDCAAPPEVALVSPEPGSRLAEGSSIVVVVEASDDDGVDRVELRVDGRLEGTDDDAPYRFPLTVPLGVRDIVLGARAVDVTGLDASTGPLLFAVEADPRTTVVGRVLDSWRDPLAGARARIRDVPDLDDTTDRGGRFSIERAPTALGEIVVEVVLPSPPRVAGASDPTAPVPGGVTDVGTIRARTLVFEDDLGEELDLDADDSVRVAFGSAFRFPFYDETYDRVFVSSNGRLTFGFGDDGDDASLFAFDRQPGIAPLFDDLDPDEDGAGVFVREHADRLVVTWNEVEGRRDRRLTFQVVLHADGRIHFAYAGVRAREALVGITPGRSSIPAESDFSRDPPFTGIPDTMIYERSEGGGDRFDLDERFLLFDPVASGAYDVDTLPLE